jgi:hypothetical protein
MERVTTTKRKFTNSAPDFGLTPNFGLTKAEVRQFKALNTPVKIQKWLDSVPYHLADTAFSPRLVLEHKTAHCLEGAMFAAAALRMNGYPPLILDFEAVNDTDHVIAVYQQGGAWGSIASSNYSTCRFRSPVYRSLRELVLSYFEGYFNLRGERTLRRFSKPVNLSRFDKRNWMTTEEPIWFIAEYLLDIPHTPLIDKKMEKNISRVDTRLFKAGQFGLRK